LIGVEEYLKLIVLVESNEHIPDWEHVIDIAWSPNPYSFDKLGIFNCTESVESKIILLIANDQSSCLEYINMIDNREIPIVCAVKEVDLGASQNLISKNARALIDHHISVEKLREVLKTAATGGLYFSKTDEIDTLLQL